MFTVNDESLLNEFETSEAENASLAKVIDETRTTYIARKLGIPRNARWGQPVLCDFGEARIGSPHGRLIRPEPYRAPEVLFDLEWTSAVDLRSLAALVATIINTWCRLT